MVLKDRRYSKKIRQRKGKSKSKKMRGGMDGQPPSKKARINLYRLPSPYDSLPSPDDSNPSPEENQNFSNLGELNNQVNQESYPQNNNEMDVSELNISDLPPNGEMNVAELNISGIQQDEDGDENNVLDLEPNAWSQDSAVSGNTSINTNDWSIDQGTLPIFGEGNEIPGMSDGSLNFSQNSSQGYTSGDLSQISIGSLGSQGGKHKKIKKKTNKKKSKKMRSTKRKSNKRNTKKNIKSKTRKGGNVGFTTTAETSPIGYLKNMEISQANMSKP